MTVAHQLKYLGHDCIPAGLTTNQPDTLELLFGWADRIIVTDRTQHVPEPHRAKLILWDVGPDRFPRPFNRELLRLVRGFVERDRRMLGAHIECR